MMQIAEIKCLSSSVGESSRGPWSSTKPHTFPRYAPKRVTTALQVKVSRPIEAVSVSCHDPVIKLLISGKSWLELLSPFKSSFNSPPLVSPISKGSLSRNAPSHVLVSVLFFTSLTHKPAVSNTRLVSFADWGRQACLIGDVRKAVSNIEYCSVAPLSVMIPVLVSARITSSLQAVLNPQFRVRQVTIHHIVTLKIRTRGLSEFCSSLIFYLQSSSQIPWWVSTQDWKIVSDV